MTTHKHEMVRIMDSLAPLVPDEGPVKQVYPATKEVKQELLTWIIKWLVVKVGIGPQRIQVIVSFDTVAAKPQLKFRTITPLDPTQLIKWKKTLEEIAETCIEYYDIQWD